MKRCMNLAMYKWCTVYVKKKKRLKKNLAAELIAAMFIVLNLADYPRGYGSDQ